MKGLLALCAALFGVVMVAGGIPRETPIGSVTTRDFRLDVFADCTSILIDAATGRHGTPTKFAGTSRLLLLACMQTDSTLKCLRLTVCVRPTDAVLLYVALKVERPPLGKPRISH